MSSDSRPRRTRIAVPRSSTKDGWWSPASEAVHAVTRRRSRNASPPSPCRSTPSTSRTASSASSRRSRSAAFNAFDYPSCFMALSDARLKAQSAFVARRLLAERLVKTSSPPEVRRAVEAVLVADRDRERALDEEVAQLLARNASAIKTSGVDYAEMYR